MTTTIIILLLVLIVEAARLALQWWSYKKYGEEREKTYCTTYKVKSVLRVVRRDPHAIRQCLNLMSADGWELVAAHYTKNFSINLYFTKKKIKNFKED